MATDIKPRLAEERIYKTIRHSYLQNCDFTLCKLCLSNELRAVSLFCHLLISCKRKQQNRAYVRCREMPEDRRNSERKMASAVALP